MTIFNTLEEKVEYIEVLLCLATYNEKIVPSQKALLSNILTNYSISLEYMEPIWKSITAKHKLDEILQKTKEKELDYKGYLIQDLVKLFYLSGNYQQEKPHLLNISKELNINVQLGKIKEHVIKTLNNA